MCLSLTILPNWNTVLSWIKLLFPFESHTLFSSFILSGYYHIFGARHKNMLYFITCNPGADVTKYYTDTDSFEVLEDSKINSHISYNTFGIQLGKYFWIFGYNILYINSQDHGFQSLDPSSQLEFTDYFQKGSSIWALERKDTHLLTFTLEHLFRNVSKESLFCKFKNDWICP